MSPETSTKTAAPATTTATVAAPIPFRKTAATSTPEVFGIFAVTLFTLVAFAGLAWFARRRGWLDRWAGPMRAGTVAGRRLSVLERLPVSRRTTLYRVRDGQAEFLLVESVGAVQLQPVESAPEVAP